MDFSPRSIYTVSALTAEIKDILETSLDEVWVEGEVSNFRVPPSGHVYFTLKDESSQIQAVVFRSQARFITFQPEDGLSVICHGRIGVYDQRGQYQLIIDFIEPRGLGALQLAFDQLKRRLEGEGLFDPSRKQPLPFLPKKIGIVTSPTGAVIRDMLTILRRRYENVGVLLYPVKVQGEGAPEEIARGITFLDRETEVDAIVVARGGGSLEDLWAFNEEVVARAIAMAEKPVLSAVGHEVDFTISDFVADVRAPTPSAAAELVVPKKADLALRIHDLQARLVRRISAALARKGERWRTVNVRLRDPRRRLGDLRLRLDDLTVRLIGSMRRVLGEQAARLEHRKKALSYRTPLTGIGRLRDTLLHGKGRLTRAMEDLMKAKRRSLERSIDRLGAMSPLAILKRGYSITRRLPSMEILREATAIKSGEEVDIKLHRGQLICRVERTEE